MVMVSVLSLPPPPGHKESVTCVGFSQDGVYVATADLSGTVKVWKVETKEEIFSFECSDAEVPHFLTCGDTLSYHIVLFYARGKISGEHIVARLSVRPLVRPLLGERRCGAFLMSI